MKCVARTAVRRRIALPEQFAQNAPTGVIGSVEGFAVRKSLRNTFPDCKDTITDPTFSQNLRTADTTSRVRDTRCLSHAS
jgi:hypothetical protein